MAKKDEVIKQLSAFKGVGEAKAASLYENGFDSIEKIRDAPIDKLTEVKGISDTLATKIKEQAEEKIPPKETKKEATKEEKPTKPEKKTEKTTEKEAEEEVKVVEEEEYQPKQKPELDEKVKEMLSLREKMNKKRPRFLRQEAFRYKRIPQNWRRPFGLTSKMRKNLKYRPSKVRVGYRGPRLVRGLHPSGFEEVLVHNVEDLEDIDPKKEAARIGGTVGTKKRVDIEEKADELGIRVLNRMQRREE